MVLVIIAMALDLHLRAVDVGRVEVEQAQLPRALFHLMGNDIRGAVPYDPLKSDQTMMLDVSADELTKVLATSSGLGGSGSGGSSSSGGSGGGASSGGGSSSKTSTSGGGSSSKTSTPGSGGTSTGGSGQGTSGLTSGLNSLSGLSTLSSSPSGSDASTTSDGQTTDPNAALCPRPQPGLYGLSDVLQVDVSRLPRLDQLSTDVIQSPGSPMPDRVSDLKTITYYVIPPENAQVISTPDGGTIVRSGLVRRELDRAVSAYAAELGILDTMDTQVEPLAPEVVAVEFSYFDGTEWLDYWDSQEMGGLPWAVEIWLYVRPPVNPSGAAVFPNDASLTTSVDGQPLLQYRHVVYLPAARAAMAQSGAGGSGESSASGSESGSSTGGGGSTAGSTTQ
jgi:hypothetical protein